MVQGAKLSFGSQLQMLGGSGTYQMLEVHAEEGLHLATYRPEGTVCRPAKRRELSVARWVVSLESLLDERTKQHRDLL